VKLISAGKWILWARFAHPWLENRKYVKLSIKMSPSLESTYFWLNVAEDLTSFATC